MTALAFVNNYQRIKSQFYPQGSHKRVRIKPIARKVYDEPIGPKIPSFYVSALMADAINLIDGGFNGSFITSKDPFALKREVKRLIAEIAMLHGVAVEDILSERRTKQIALARQHVMVEMKARTPWSIAQIGRYLGRDHTSVLHALKVFKKRAEENGVEL
jgi:hypothetical protein